MASKPDRETPHPQTGTRRAEPTALGPGTVRPPTLLSLPSYLAANVARVGTRLLMHDLHREGLRLSHHAVLAALNDFGPLAQHEITDRLEVDRSQVVGFVDRLESQGLVTRARDAQDRRRVRVSLTPKGRRLERRLTTSARRSQDALLGALSPTEQTTLVGLLRRVLDSHDGEQLELVDP